MKRVLFSILIFLSLAIQGQKPRPPLMGWSSWNAYRANINDSILRAQAGALVTKGLSAVGYKYVNIDDGFFNGRDAEGNILIDAKKFPHGMKALADYIHSKGLKAGMYGDAGPNTCASIWETPPETGGIGAGFYNHEEKDMLRYFITWGFDYVKVDYCGASQQKLKLDEQTQYTKIKKAIEATGKKDYVLNVCRWQFPGAWVTRIADSWRISGDINATYKRMLDIVDLNTFLAPFMSPGHYNDMDMLEIGNGTSLTVEENRTQMSLWAVLTSPLVLGTDLNKLSAENMKIITNEEVIAVNQDMTEQGHLISNYKDPLQVWSKKLNGKQSGERAVVLFNRNDKPEAMTIHFADVELQENVFVRDIWAKENKGNFTGSYTTTVPSHGVAFLILKGKNKTKNVYEAEYAYLNNFNLTQNTIVVPNQAKPVFSETASKKALVTSLGNNAENYIEFRDVFVAKTGKYKINIYYACNENTSADILVNGKATPSQKFQSTNNKINNKAIFISLKKGPNNIRFSNSITALPDFDKIEIENIKN